MTPNQLNRENEELREFKRLYEVMQKEYADHQDYIEKLEAENKALREEVEKLKWAARVNSDEHKQYQESLKEDLDAALLQIGKMREALEAIADCETDGQTGPIRPSDEAEIAKAVLELYKKAEE